MSSEDAALVPLWAEPDDAVGEALKAVYEDIPGHVVGLIEFHRIEATNDYLKNMCESRDALAPYGKFKDWCDAGGVNYGAVSKALSRRFGNVTPDTRESHSKLPSEAASDARLLFAGSAVADDCEALIQLVAERLLANEYASDNPLHTTADDTGWGDDAVLASYIQKLWQVHTRPSTPATATYDDSETDAMARMNRLMDSYRERFLAEGRNLWEAEEGESEFESRSRTAFLGLAGYMAHSNKCLLVMLLELGRWLRDRMPETWVARWQGVLCLIILDYPGRYRVQTTQDLYFEMLALSSEANEAAAQGWGELMDLAERNERDALDDAVSARITWDDAQVAWADMNERAERGGDERETATEEGSSRS